MAPGNKLSGQVEADETFIGGKARNMHASKRARKVTGTGGKDKTAVMGILERGGKVRTAPRLWTIRRKRHYKPKFGDTFWLALRSSPNGLKSYEGLDEFQHEVIDHAVAYVDGEVHTNGLENFWSLLKRGLKGTYVSVEPFHLFRYLDEQMFRYNNRKGYDDKARFDLAVRQIVGRRLTFDQLTGKTSDERTQTDA
jgi:hypothetical protein